MIESHVDFTTRMEQRFPGLFGQGQYGGFDIEPGWRTLVQTLCHSIECHTESVARDHDLALRTHAAKQQGYDAVLALCARGSTQPSQWDQQRADEIWAEPHTDSVPDAMQPVTILQVKEKFGTLRFYYQGGDQFVRGAVWVTEGMSAHVCETCGAPGSRGGTGWIRTLCPTHRAQHDAQRAQS